MDSLSSTNQQLGSADLSDQNNIRINRSINNVSDIVLSVPPQYIPSFLQGPREAGTVIISVFQMKEQDSEVNLPVHTHTATWGRASLWTQAVCAHCYTLNHIYMHSAFLMLCFLNFCFGLVVLILILLLNPIWYKSEFMLHSIKKWDFNGIRTLMMFNTSSPNEVGMYF